MKLVRVGIFFVFLDFKSGFEFLKWRCVWGFVMRAGDDMNSIVRIKCLWIKYNFVRRYKVGNGVNEDREIVGWVWEE